MTNIKAFPNGVFMDDKGKIIGGHMGMDLRDYFAAKAMQQMNWLNADISAEECYRIADAMMKARKNV